MCKKSCSERICEEKEADVVYGFDWSSYCKLVVEPEEVIEQVVEISLPDGTYCCPIENQPSVFIGSDFNVYDSLGNLIEN